MTIFEEPKIEVIRLDPDDIITESNCGQGEGDNEVEAEQNL